MPWSDPQSCHSRAPSRRGLGKSGNPSDTVSAIQRSRFESVSDEAGLALQNLRAPVQAAGQDRRHHIAIFAPHAVIESSRSIRPCLREISGFRFAGGKSLGRENNRSVPASVVVGCMSAVGPKMKTEILA